MAASPTTVSGVLLLFVGMVVALLALTQKERKVTRSNMINTPMIGMRFRNGPWPKCVGMDGDECCQYIESYAKDVRGNCVVADEDDELDEDFDTTRVRVFVDGDNIVVKTPDRG